MEMESIIKSIASKVDNRVREGDYREDGILYCGKCKKPREYKHEDEDGKVYILPCVCKCDEQRFKAEQDRLDQMERNAQLRELRGISLMESRYYDASFDKLEVIPDNERNIRLCKRYATAFSEMIAKNQGLLMYGGVGTGKSYASACIANYLMEHGTSVVMTSFVKLIEQAQSGKDAEQMLYSKLGNAKLVIFDDLGAERNTDYALERVYSLIDHRYRQGLPMIITTNLTPKEMMSEPDVRLSRIYDRIFETCYPMQFKGDSWRKIQANRRYKEFDTLK